MMQSKGDISDLFKSGLEGYEATIEDDDWLKTEIELNKRKFYKFSFTHFNIYYASAVITSTVLTVLSFGVWITKVAKSDDKINLDKVSVSLNADSNFKEQISKENIVKDKNFKKDNGDFYPNKKIDPKFPDSIDSLQSKESIDTTMNGKPDPSYTIPGSNENSKDLNRKVVYITRQDTIIKYDTLRVKKGKRRKW